MSREEAIKICKQVRKYFKGGKLATDDTDAIYGALTEAIEALKAQRQMIYICKTVEREKFEEMTKNYQLMLITPDAEKVELIREQQWIPCSERLPSAEHNLEGFLVTSKLPNYLEDDADVFFEVYYNGQFGSHWDGERLGHVDDGVIAWMECPSPYKGE